MQLKNEEAPAEVLQDQGRGNKASSMETDEATAQKTEPQIQSYDDLRRLTRDLETIADWLDDLRFRIARAHLRFQVCGLNEEEHRQLDAEVLKFKQVCASLFGDPRRLERKAAA